MRRDYILSFFVWPGRVISPAAISEIRNGKFGKEVEPASEAAVRSHIQFRLDELHLRRGADDGPVSEFRVRSLLRLARESQFRLPGLESHIVEFKENLPLTGLAKSKAATTLASFANNKGGYLIFGVRDGGTVIGVESSAIQQAWEELSDILSRHFTPFFPCVEAAVEASGKIVAAVYAYAAEEKPIIASGNYEEIKRGTIYFRYHASTQPIAPADLISIIRQIRASGELVPSQAAS